MSSFTFNNGITHIFGTKSGNSEVITLKAAPGQQLALEGSVVTPSGLIATSLEVTGTTDSTSTTTGSIKTAGGLGVAKDIYCDQLFATSTTPSTSRTTGSIVCSGGAGFDQNVFANAFNAQSVLDSSSVSTGAIVTAGGVGIAKKLNAARGEFTDTTASTSTTTGSLLNDGGFGNAGAIFTDTLNTTATTASTSTTTGSIISAGGIGCSGRLFTSDITVSTPNYSLITFFTAVSIPNGSWTNPFTGGIGTRTDSGTACSSTTSGVVTIATSGVYSITYGAAFAANATSIRGYRIRFTTGTFVGQTIIGTVLVDATTTATFNTEHTWTISVPLVAGNVIIMEIIQACGGALNSINNVFCVSRQI